MSARRKRAGTGQSARPKKNPLKAGSPATPPRQQSLVSAEKAFEECIGAICLVEVTLHSLESQEIATPEQEVLKRALKAIWCVHDLLDSLKLDDIIGASTDREDES